MTASRGVAAFGYFWLASLGVLFGACDTVADPIGGLVPVGPSSTGSDTPPTSSGPDLDAGGSESPRDAEVCKPTSCARDVPLALRDTDGDGVRDMLDPDDDGDGVSDREECGHGSVGLVNGDFEAPFIEVIGEFRWFNSWDVPGWNVIPAEAQLELWTDGFAGVPANNGRQFAELNAMDRSGVYQDFSTPTATRLSWAFSHRGRDAADTVRILFGTPESMASQGEFVTRNGEWQIYDGIYEVPLGQVQTRIMLEAVSGEKRANLIDQVWVEPVCELDLDKDGCPDSEDADTQDPECSGAGPE